MNGKWITEEEFNEIVDAYNGSIEETAEETGFSVIQVRRVLITAGLWESPRSNEIKELLDEGFSTDMISKLLGISIKTVQNYMPYTPREDNENARAVRKSREKLHEEVREVYEKEPLHIEVTLEQFVRQCYMNRDIRLIITDDELDFGELPVRFVHMEKTTEKKFLQQMDDELFYRYHNFTTYDLILYLSEELESANFVTVILDADKGCKRNSIGSLNDLVRLIHDRSRAPMIIVGSRKFLDKLTMDDFGMKLNWRLGGVLRYDL